ncbi:hypothetical protein [Paenibacillus jilunlii]|uniref:Uncharacterized protein n=1 Tax=Paenibacillus jilunlii TaxID=682956 RepID=A0A1G9YDI1_9BACL|nr:hypothetical protein [Paenibacillus jilunlii]SDN07110.1 hypothetical protein SAMN05216191_1268 [Paenibacillus jilunlii]
MITTDNTHARTGTGISGIWELTSTEGTEGLPFHNSIKETLHLDVDGETPQMVVSGTWTLHRLTLHWIAKLEPIGTNAWKGNIFYKDGDVSMFPYNFVTIEAQGLTLRNAKVVYSEGATPLRTAHFTWVNQYFYPVEFEYDTEEGITPVLAIDTHAHPNHPANLPREELSIESVYRRAGFDVKLSTGNSVVPLVGAGNDVRWSDAEMHDAMQVHWSQYSNNPKWAMWVFFASLHEEGYPLGGIMFDDIGSQHRQGTAIFNNSFISNAPENDVQPDAWVKRMKFWTACHEMGHGFNLAHAWQKSLGNPWLPLQDDAEVRSFMNYPFAVQGGVPAFFQNFEYRFSDNELLFLRHAPERFVKMGEAEWFDDHGFKHQHTMMHSTFKLTLRVNRETNRYEYLEPVCVELKLSNVSKDPQIVNKDVLANIDRMTIIVKKNGGKAKQLLPYVHYLQEIEKEVLMPGQTMYSSIFASVGNKGWLISEPGDYLIQVAIHLENEDVLSNELMIRVEPPIDRTEDFLAQDFFSNDVARTLFFDGTKSLENSNNILRTVAERLPHRKVAVHAEVALAMPLMKPFKLLGQDKIIHVTPPQIEEATQLLKPALLERSHVAANTLGHLDYHFYMDRLSESIAAHSNHPEGALAVQNKLLQTLTERKVKPVVLQEIKDKQLMYEKLGPGTSVR